MASIIDDLSSLFNNVLRVFDRKTRRTDRVTEQTATLDHTVYGIFQRFFDPLVTLHVQLLSQTGATSPTAEEQEEQERLKGSSQKSFLDMFYASIARHMFGSKAAQDMKEGNILRIIVPQVLHSYYSTHVQPHLRFSWFIEELAIIFSKQDTYYSLCMSDKTIPTIIARAIQDVVINEALNNIYRTEGHVSRDIKTTLENILQDIEDIRTRYGVHVNTLDTSRIPVSIRNLNDAKRELQLQISRVNKTLWLPLKPFVTALSRKKISNCM